MNIDNIQIDDSGIDIKEVFRTLYRNKFIIIVFTILFGLASSYYAYFKPNIYQATATVEVGLNQRGYAKDVINMATEAGSLISDTEKEIIKSRFLAEKVLKEVDFAHKYYTVRKFKEVELYKASPFEVAMNRGYGISFDFYPVDDKSYRLVVSKANDAHGSAWSYDKIHLYDKDIVTVHFHLNITKTKEAKETKYRFLVIDPERMKNFSLAGVSIGQSSKFSTILRISYSDTIALRAKEVSNALARAYIRQSINKKTKEATRKLAFIDKQLKKITENLKGSAIKLEEFKRTSNTIDLSSKAENIIAHISDYETKLTEVSMQEEMLNSLYNQVKSGKNLENLTVLGAELGGSVISPMIQKLQESIMKKKILRESYTELHPEVRKLKKTIVQLKKMIVTTIKNLQQSSKERKKKVKKK